MKRRTILATALGLSFGAPLLAQLRRNKLDAATNVLESAVVSRQVDAAALYVRQGDAEFARAFGAAKNVDAIFLLASITKPITVAAVMTLYEAGEFRLDDRVQKFIPEFTGDGRDQITMQQLFTHTSGLPDQLAENRKLRVAHAQLSEFVKGAIRTTLMFPPGSKYGYSSMGILLASEVARRISGKPIAALVDETVCQPLAMQRSALGVGRLKRDELLRCQTQSAAPESGSGDLSTKSWDWNSDYWRNLGVPWGGAHASIGDVALFLDAFLHPSGKLLKPDTARMMIENHNPPHMHSRGLGFDFGSGLGGPKQSRNVFGHTGATGTLCWADPTTDSMCIVLTTLPGGAASPHPRELASQHASEAVS